MKSTVSIIIDNYNYAGYLRRALDSALQQTYEHVEVIVVDDGSTDDSRGLILEYGDRIKTVFKTNGGQGSAFNAGFRASSGEIVFFLDSDDMLQSDAVTTVVAFMRNSNAVKVHWPMRIIDALDVPTGEVRFKGLPSGDLRQRVATGGPGNSPSSPTSGNAWRRSLLEKILPVPENCRYYRSCADEYLYNLAPFFGNIGMIETPLTSYRVHGANIFSSRTFTQKFRMEVDGYEEQCTSLLATLARNGIAADAALWRKHSWYPRLQEAIKAVGRSIPSGSRVALVHDGALYELDVLFPNHRVHHFPEREGIDWGAPADSAAAIDELVRARAGGIEYLAVLWPAFWWIDSYPEFMEHLRSNQPTVIDDTHCVIVRLGKLEVKGSSPNLVGRRGKC
jgi:glycosyltransferase involved in cell wall biosynthesis